MKSHVKTRGLPGFIAQAKFAYGTMNPERVCKWARHKALAADMQLFRGNFVQHVDFNTSKSTIVLVRLFQIILFRSLAILFCSLKILISFPRNSISFPRNSISFPRNSISFPRISISFPRNKENNLQMSLWEIKLEPQRGHGGSNYFVSFPRNNIAFPCNNYCTCTCGVMLGLAWIIPLLSR